MPFTSHLLSYGSAGSLQDGPLFVAPYLMPSIVLSIVLRFGENMHCAIRPGIEELGDHQPR